MQLSVRAASLALGLLLAAASAGFASGDYEREGWIAGSGNVRIEDRDAPAFGPPGLRQAGRFSIMGAGG
jgi:hypothetical protein